MRWWKRERNSTDFGFLSSNGGAVCNTVFRIGTVGAEVKPFSTGFFFFGKRTAGLGLEAFSAGVGRSGIRLGRILALRVFVGDRDLFEPLKEPDSDLDSRRRW